MNGRIKSVIPVLLGGDMGAYSLSVSFARAYGLRSHVFAREKLAIVDNFEYIDLHVVNGLDNPDVAVPVLLAFAKENKGKELLLIPCADWYMEMLEYARDALDGHFYFFIPSFEVWRVTSDKSSFLKMLDKYGVSHPQTVVLDSSCEQMDSLASVLTPPFVLKPADSSEYWRHKFDGMEKVFYLHSLGDVKAVGKRIFASGYSGKLILQEYVGVSEKPAASVLTVFLNSEAKAQRAVLGDVLLDEKSPTARGNYTAIVTRKLDKISLKVIDMLESIGYTGVANVDILYDKKCGYVLELNPRQGRSFDYIRSAGIELSELFMKTMLGERIEPKLDYKCGFWCSVGKRSVRRYSDDRALLKRAAEYIKNGMSFSPYDFKSGRGVRHRLYEIVHKAKMERRYRTIMKEDRNAAK